MYLVHRVKIINIRTSVTMKVLKLDDKVKAINICDDGECCQAVAEEMGDGRTQIMKILLKKCEILTILKTMFPSSRKRQHLVFWKCKH